MQVVAYNLLHVRTTLKQPLVTWRQTYGTYTSKHTTFLHTTHNILWWFLGSNHFYNWLQLVHTAIDTTYNIWLVWCIYDLRGWGIIFTTAFIHRVLQPINATKVAHILQIFILIVILSFLLSIKLWHYMVCLRNSIVGSILE